MSVGAQGGEGGTGGEGERERQRSAAATTEPTHAQGGQNEEQGESAKCTSRALPFSANRAVCFSLWCAPPLGPSIASRTAALSGLCALSGGQSSVGVAVCVLC